MRSRSPSFRPASLKAGLALLLPALLLAGCVSRREAAPPPTAPAPVTQGPPASGAPWDQVVKVGKPYQVSGVWYQPLDDRRYEETGLASWYGPGFHAKQTANGEPFDQEAVSAAHKTLPLPSYVEVQNLENGRRLVVRVNDRGPFVDARIIDLSRRSAELLGIHGPGIARVRVRRITPSKEEVAALRPPHTLERPALLAAAVIPPPPPAIVAQAEASPPPAPVATRPPANIAPTPTEDRARPPANIAPTPPPDRVRPPANIAPNPSQDRARPPANIAPDPAPDRSRPPANIAPAPTQERVQPPANIAPSPASAPVAAAPSSAEAAQVPVETAPPPAPAPVEVAPQSAPAPPIVLAAATLPSTPFDRNPERLPDVAEEPLGEADGMILPEAAAIETVSIPAPEIAPREPGAMPPGSILIQVAAVADKARATRLAGNLSKIAPVRIETTPTGLHRVRLGPFPSREAAATALSRVRAAGYQQAWIVSTPPTS